MEADARRASSALFASGVVLGQVGQNTMLPLFADAVGAGGSTPYFVVWIATFAFVVLFGLWVLLLHLLTNAIPNAEAAMLSVSAQIGPLQVGLANALNGMMVVFASPSGRTAPYLQALLGNLTIPFTIAFRIIFFKHVPNASQLVAACLVMLGMYIAVIPTISQWSGPDRDSQQSGLFWPMIFMAGFIPASFMIVREEQALRQGGRNVHTLVFVFWLNFWQHVFVNLLFWLDVVPGYGMSASWGAWLLHMRHGFAVFLTAPGFGWGMAFIVFYMLAYVASGLLLRHSEGAVWQTIVTAVVGPLGTLWWTLFQAKPHLHWHPEWALTTTFAMLALVVMTPGIVLFKAKAARSSSDVALHETRTKPLLCPSPEDLLGKGSWQQF